MIEDTLKERGARYGEFKDHADISQALKTILKGKGNTTDLVYEIVPFTNWNGLLPDQKEALEMIMHKVARILNGDPNYHDSWHDIAGYAQLVANRIGESK